MYIGTIYMYIVYRHYILGIRDDGLKDKEVRRGQFPFPMLLLSNHSSLWKASRQNGEKEKYNESDSFFVDFTSQTRTQIILK